MLRLSVVAVLSILAFINPTFAQDHTPRDRYKAYETAVIKAKKFSDVKDFFASDVYQSVAASPEKTRKQILGMEKSEARNVKGRFISQNITGDTAKVIYDISKYTVASGKINITSAKLIVNMKRENGKWRIVTKETAVKAE